MLPTSLGASPDGVLTALSPGHEVDSVELHRRSATPVAVVRHRGRVLVTAFDSDGGLLATAGEDQLVQLWRVSELAPD